jgi:hypothetical protein
MEVYDVKQLMQELRAIAQLLARQNELLYAILERVK